ncbi:starch-binding protein [Bacteroidia bacterium]|nr:starch-binding protein [Bacteroidia bacterium]
MDMIKNICKNIITDAARRDAMHRVSTFIVAAMCIFPSCRDYLDIVPDNTLTLDNLFAVRDQAYNALANAYSYMPREDLVNSSTWLMGDEYIYGSTFEDDEEAVRGIRIMRGLQSTKPTYLGTWSGTGGGQPLYEGIRQCNIFIARIDGVKDMETAEKAEWKAQVTFLKAYYHFLLLQKYGPIVIMDEAVPADAAPADLFAIRYKVDACFDYIVKTIDEAIPNLLPRKSDQDIGQVDMLAAASIKARVLLFRASPFYSGSMEYFGDFFDPVDKQPYFPVNDDAATTKAKWKDAVDAIDEAIKLCTQYGRGLYSYDKPVLLDDIEDFAANRQNMQTYYDLRMVMADPWNKELIWGFSNVDQIEQSGSLGMAANIYLPASYPGTHLYGFCWNRLGATYKMVERYYTKNGLPLAEDRTIDIDTMLQLTVTPGPGDAAYTDTRGILLPNAEIINLYLNREPRFYANLGLTGTYWRGHSLRISTEFYASKAGGYNPSQPDYSLWTGIGIQKVVHIASKALGWAQIIRYPLPIIRMADLYLMKAEALNEYLDAPTKDVYDAINMVRDRAGIPKVEVVWSNPALAKTVNKHQTKDGMRDIILQERGIELAFEGSRFYDMLRHKRAIDEFSAPALGWSEKSATGSDFFKLEAKQVRKFSLRDCLWPIDIDELNTNAKLIQSPGW